MGPTCSVEMAAMFCFPVPMVASSFEIVNVHSMPLTTSVRAWARGAARAAAKSENRVTNRFIVVLLVAGHDKKGVLHRTCFHAGLSTALNENMYGDARLG